MKTLSKKLLYIALVLIIASCANKKNWQTARIVFRDNSEIEMLFLAKDFSYYNFVKAKDSLKAKTQILIPENVSLVESTDEKYISMFFNEKEFGMESFSFGKWIVGEELMLVYTKFQAKTCACKTSGTYFKGYFFVNNDSIFKIKTDSKNNVYNKVDVYEFFDKYSEYSLPKDINTIEDIVLFMENINNLNF